MEQEHPDDQLHKLYEDCRELAKKYPIVIKTARQHPRPPGYRAPPVPASDVIFIDYLTKP